MFFASSLPVTLHSLYPKFSCMLILAKIPVYIQVSWKSTASFKGSWWRGCVQIVYREPVFPYEVCSLIKLCDYVSILQKGTHLQCSEEENWEERKLQNKCKFLDVWKILFTTASSSSNNNNNNNNNNNSAPLYWWYFVLCCVPVGRSVCLLMNSQFSSRFSSHLRHLFVCWIFKLTRLVVMRCHFK